MVRPYGWQGGPLLLSSLISSILLFLPNIRSATRTFNLSGTLCFFNISHDKLEPVNHEIFEIF